MQKKYLNSREVYTQEAKGMSHRFFLHCMKKENVNYKDVCIKCMKMNKTYFSRPVTTANDGRSLEKIAYRHKTSRIFWNDLKFVGMKGCRAVLL